MDIVLIHLGDPLPAYLPTCIKQIRKFTDDRIVVAMSEEQIIHFACEDNVLAINLSQIPKSENWLEFEKSQYLDGFAMNGFWKYACERLFALETIMDLLNLDKALHIENDNLIYGKPDEDFFKTQCGSSIGLTPINDFYLSAGVMYVGSRNALSVLNGEMNGLMKQGLRALQKKYGDEMLHEMRLLKIIRDENPILITLLPIYPDIRSKYVYDCASWGQYIGGAHQAPGVPYKTETHFIGDKIIKGIFDVKWETVNKLKLPFVITNPIEREPSPLFNLHIHSKQLERWVS